MIGWVDTPTRYVLECPSIRESFFDGPSVSIFEQSSSNCPGQDASDPERYSSFSTGSSPVCGNQLHILRTDYGKQDSIFNDEV